MPQYVLKKLLNHLLNRFRPDILYFYKTSKFIREELDVFEDYARKGTKIFLVHVNRFKPLRAFEGASTIRRGFFAGLKLFEREDIFCKVKCFLWTTGNLILEGSPPRKHRLGTPRGIEITALANVDIRDIPQAIELEEHVARQVLALTKLNWNTLEWEIREPVITSFARKAARIAAELERLGLGPARTYDIRDFI